MLAITMLVFVPVFFFASEYAQMALGKSPSEAGLYILYFFIGFVIAAQIGGTDARPGRRPSARSSSAARSAPSGFGFGPARSPAWTSANRSWYIILAGAGMGMMLGPASTDAVNRASRLSYGEATGITQTVRNYAASLGLAILGTLLVSQLRSHVGRVLDRQGDAFWEARTPRRHRSLRPEAAAAAVGAIPAFRASRLRLRDAFGALCDGGDHGACRRRRFRGFAGGFARAGRPI